MGPIPESSANLLVSALMGIVGGLITIPFSAFSSWLLKRSEQDHQHKLNKAEKKYELLLKHRFEYERQIKDVELDKLRTEIRQLNHKITMIEKAIK